jgi:uncharacterized protein (DUF58 family)
VPTRRALVLVPVGVALALSGLAYGVEEFVLVALSAGAAVVAALGLLLVSGGTTRRAVHVDLVVPPGELSVGEPAVVTVVVENRGGRPLPELWLERDGGWQVSYPGWAPSSASADGGQRWTGRPRRRGLPSVARRLGGAAPVPSAARRVTVPPLPPGRRFATRLVVPTERRGLWSLESRRLWCADPFGLFVRQVGRSPGAHLVVCPVPATRVSGGAPEADAGRPDALIEAHGQTRRAVGGGDELAGLRPYRPGDRLNRLHWPAMARAGALVVRDFVEPEARSVEVVVDDRPLIVEGSVSSAARRGIAALEDGTVVDLVAGSGARLSVAPGAGARRTLLQALAVVGPAERWSR